MIIGTKGDNKLEDIIRDFKSFTSRHIRKELEACNYESRKEWLLWMMKRAGSKKSNNKDFQLWQQHNHSIEISSNDILDSRLNYIHQNPVESGLVENARDWVCSSAKDYEGEKGLLDLYLLC